MIININIDIELNNDQIHLLRTFYIDKSTKQFWGRDALSMRPDLDKSIAESLVNIDILKKDNMMNYTLTILGHKIIDKIDRDKIIDRIINNE
jgi:hypothetical protein